MLSKKENENFILADYLKYSLLFYSTHQYKLWEKLETVSQAQMRLGGDLNSEFTEVATSHSGKKVMALSWADSLKAYLYVYKDNLEEVLARYANEENKSQLVYTYDPNRFSSRQEALASYELTSRITADTVSILSGAAAGGLSIINSILR